MSDTTDRAILPLTYSAESEDLRETVRGMLDRHCPWQDVLVRTESGDRADELWSRLTDELGALGLPIDEERGGQGGTWSEMAVVAEELGRSIADVPFLGAAIAVGVLDAIGADELLRASLGERTAVVVAPWNLAWDRARWAPPQWDGHRLTGQVRLVADATDAAVLLVPVDGSIIAVDATSATITPAISLDMTRKLADIRFDACPGELLASGAVAEHALSTARLIGSVLLAAEQVGLARRSLELAVEYASQRRQFGRLIGSYQANKHRLADVWVRVQQSTAVARHAVAALAFDDELPIAASLASFYCSRAAETAAAELLQIHGGIGVTWEHPSHLYVKRARADALALGSPAWHRAHLAELLELTQPAAGM